MMLGGAFGRTNSASCGFALLGANCKRINLTSNKYKFTINDATVLDVALVDSPLETKGV
jgi:hypothetical protein